MTRTFENKTGFQDDTSYVMTREGFLIAIGFNGTTVAMGEKVDFAEELVKNGVWIETTGKVYPKSK